jgi:amino acid transporter
LQVLVREKGRFEGVWVGILPNHFTANHASDYTSHAFTPGWKPTGFDSTITPVLRSTGVDDAHFGIAGSGGRFFALLYV